MAVDVTPPLFYDISYNAGAAFTACGWVKSDRIPPASFGYNTCWFMDGLSYNAWTAVMFIRVTSTTMRIDLVQDGPTAITGPAVNTGQWIFIAYTRSGDNLNMYWRTEGQSSLSSGSGVRQGNLSILGICVLGERFPEADTTLDGQGAYWRHFESVLSSSAILSESASTTAVATEWADWPFASAATVLDDVSGANRDLTSNGTGSVANGTNPNIALPSGGAAPDGRSRRYRFLLPR